MKNSLPKRQINVFTLTMITAAFIMAIRNFSTMAETGLQVIFFCLVAAIGFLVPVALVSAELATGWPKQGGVYAWVKEAFGERWGFLAIFLQWVENVIWFPTALSFLAGTLAYAFLPDLAHNEWYLTLTILVVYWGATFLNLLGMKISAWMSTICVIGGVFIPAAIIILLAVFYLLQGAPSYIDFSLSFSNFFPDLSKFNNLSILGGFVFSLMGVEASAVHAQDVKNPQRNYPIAIFFAACLLVVLNIVGSLSIAVAVPQKDISLVAGIMETFRVFLNNFHLEAAVPVMALLITIGALGQVSTWILGPCKGLLATARFGDLPPYFQKVTSKGMPSRLLFTQGIIVTLLSMLFLFMPTINSSYWILLELATLLYLIMYVMLFITAIRLRYTKPNVVRAFQVPGGKVGIWVAGGLGLLCAIFTLFVGFFPPSQFSTGSEVFYFSFLFIGLLVIVSIPLLISQFKKSHWISTDESLKGEDGE